MHQSCKQGFVQSREILHDVFALRVRVEDDSRQILAQYLKNFWPKAKTEPFLILVICDGYIDLS